MERFKPNAKLKNYINITNVPYIPSQPTNRYVAKHKIISNVVCRRVQTQSSRTSFRKENAILYDPVAKFATIAATTIKGRCTYSTRAAGSSDLIQIIRRETRWARWSAKGLHSRRRSRYTTRSRPPYRRLCRSLSFLFSFLSFFFFPGVATCNQPKFRAVNQYPSPFRRCTPSQPPTLPPLALSISETSASSSSEALLPGSRGHSHFLAAEFSIFIDHLVSSARLAAKRFRLFSPGIRINCRVPSSQRTAFRSNFARPMWWSNYGEDGWWRKIRRSRMEDES